MQLSEATLDDFRAFVKKEAENNPYRVINHSSWDSCALGDFVRDCVESVTYLTIFEYTDLAIQLFGPKGQGLNVFMADTTSDYNTYGALYPMLEEMVELYGDES